MDFIEFLGKTNRRQLLRMRVDAESQGVCIVIVHRVIVSEESITDQINLVKAVWERILFDQELA